MADNNTITVDSPEQQPTITVDSPVPPATAPLPPQTAQDRGNAASFGLSQITGIAPTDFSKAVSTGKENEIRFDAANKVDGVRQQMAKQVIGNQWYDMTPEAIQQMLKPQDPNSVFEEHYANSYYQHVFWPRDPDNKANDTFMYQMNLGVPEQLDAMGRTSQDMIAKNEYFRTAAQNSEAADHWYTTGSFLVKDVATMGLYSEYELRTGAADVGTVAGGLGLGSNLDEQRRNLYDLPMDQFKSEVDRVVTSLPKDLRTPWLSAMLDRSQSQTSQYNLFSALTALGAGDVVKSVASPVERSLRSTALSSTAFSRVTKAFSDMTVARQAGIPAEVAAPAVAGNLKQSAINKVAVDKVNQLNPNYDPFSEWKARATGYSSVDSSLIRDNPGSLGQEAANRVADMYDSMHKDMVEAVQNAERIDPNPTSGMQDRLNTIWDHLVGKFSGPDNQLLNVSRGEVVANYVPGLNVRRFDIPMGTADGDVFNSLGEAKESARRAGWAIKGDYDVKPDELVKIRRIEASIKGFRQQAANAATLEGAARANAIADKAQAKLDAIPKHTTGVTIEELQHPSVAAVQETPQQRPPRVPENAEYIGKNKDGDAIWRDPPSSEYPDGRRHVYVTSRGLTAHETILVKGPRIRYGEEDPLFVVKDKPATTPTGPTPPSVPKPPKITPEEFSRLTPEERHARTEAESQWQQYEANGGTATQPAQPYKTIVERLAEQDIEPDESILTSLRDKSSVPETMDELNAKAERIKTILEGKASTRTGIWSNADHDLPVEIVDEPANRGPDGRLYQKVRYEGRDTYVPADELKETSAAKPTSRALLAKQNPDFVVRMDAEMQAKHGRPATFQELVDALDAEHSLGEVDRTKGKGQRNRPFKITSTDELPTEGIRNLARGLRDERNIPPAEEPVIKQQGNGFYINHSVYLPEQANFVRDGILTSKVGEMSVEDYRDAVVNNKVSTGLPPSWFGGWASAMFGRLIGPAETLSAAEQINRSVATHGPSIFLGLMKKGMIPIDKIPPRFQQDFNRLISAAQSEWNEATKSPGIWYDHPSQIEDFYQRNFKRSPDETEIKAYFAYKQLVLNDLLFRELAVMRKKIVMGVKQHAIRYTDKSGVKTATGFFEGVARTEFPKEGRVLVVNGADSSKSKYRWASNVERFQPEVLNDIREGKAQLIHIVDPSSRPLKDLVHGSPDYVIAYRTDQKPIGLHHVNRTGAGHLVPEGQFYIKGANIDIADFGEDGIHRYYNGDTTALNFTTRYEAEAALPHLEEVRKKFAAFRASPEFKEAEAIQRWENEGGRTGANSYMDDAADYAQATGLPFSKLVEWYFGKNGAPPRLDANEPLHVVKAGQKIIDLPNSETHFLERHPNLHDNTKSGTLLSQVMAEFTQERDMEGLYTLKDIGTEQAPLFKYQPAEFIDPITVMNRGLNRIVNSMYMNDMKQFSMEHWLEQAKDYLNINSLNDFRNNPLQWFHNPEYRDGVPYRIRGQLETTRLQALDFIGTPSVFETALREMTQKLADNIFGKFRIKVPFLYDLPKTSSVTAFLRGTAFAASQIGLKQFFTQASSMFNIVGIAGPRYAAKGTAAATMYAYWRMFSGRPEILEGLDKKLALHFGWKLGEFKNAVGLIERSGFGHIGEEHAIKSNATTLGLESMKNITPFTIGLKTAKAYGRTLLHWGTTPFEMGTAVTRRAAFFTSYLEHLDREGALILDRQMSGSILRRASLLDANMSRAYSSALHTGAMSIPMQFSAYDIRMTEMMFGNNLTREQKLRLFVANSAMYGLRGGYFALLGLPLTDYAVRKLQESGYVPGENGLMDAIVNGFPSWAFAYLSGFTDPNGKKTWLDFSNWGNKGISAMDDFFDKDKTLAEIMSGVIGNVFVNSWQGSEGFRRDMWSIATNDDRFKLNGDDVFQMFKALSVVNDIDRAKLAFNTGKWFTRNGTYVTDMSKLEAIVQLITGVSPLKGKDVWQKQQSISELSTENRKYEREATLEMQRAFRDRQNNDEAGFDQHWHTAGAIIQVNMPPHLWGQAVKTAMQNVGISLDDRLDKKLLDLTNDFDLYAKRKGQQ